MNEKVDKIEIIVERVLSLIVCTNVTDEDKLAYEVNKMHLCGTTAGWVISDRKDRTVQCDKYPDRKHWLFTC